MRLQQRLYRQAALRSDIQGHAGTLHNQQGLVTGQGRVLLGGDLPGRIRWPSSVAATDHADTQPALAKEIDQPADHRRLAGATQGDIADHQHRHRRAIDRAPPLAERIAPTAQHLPIERFQGTQQVQGRVPGIPGAQQALSKLHGAGCASTVVMRRWAKPSLPAASMAVMTAWWVAWASALITNGRLLSPCDSACKAAIRVCRSCWRS